MDRLLLDDRESLILDRLFFRKYLLNFLIDKKNITC